MRLSDPDNYQAMAENTIEINVKGKWIRVPALHVNGTTVIVRKGRPRVAVIHDEEWLEAELQDPDLCVRELKAQRPELRADIFTFSQKVPATPPKYKYVTELDSIAVTHFGSFNDWWLKLPQETRKNVRRSQKRGVVVEVKDFDDALVRAISEVNNDSPVLQRLPNIYYGRSFDQVRRDYSAFLGRCDFICARIGPEPIGFLKLVYRGDVASILNLTTKPGHYDKRPANALIAKAVELCVERRIPYLTYGRFSYGNKRASPLQEFKTRNGFKEMLIPRFYVPLTALGNLCVTLHFHRGLLGILPYPLIVLGVNARAKWYSFRLFMSRCSSKLEQLKRNRQMERSNPPAGSTF